MWRWCGEVTRGSPTDDSTHRMSEAIFPALANGKFEYFCGHDCFFFLPTTGVENGKIGSCEPVCESPRCCGESTGGECESLFANFWS